MKLFKNLCTAYLLSQRHSHIIYIHNVHCKPHSWIACSWKDVLHTLHGLIITNSMNIHRANLKCETTSHFTTQNVRELVPATHQWLKPTQMQSNPYLNGHGKPAVTIYILGATHGSVSSTLLNTQIFLSLLERAIWIFISFIHN